MPNASRDIPPPVGVLPYRCAACGARVDYGTDGRGVAITLPCLRCAHAARMAVLLVRVGERRREQAARRRVLLAALGALMGAHYRGIATPTQHTRGRWRRKAKRATTRRKALGLPRAETARQQAQRRAGVAKLRADPVYCAIENIRRRERAAAQRAAGIKRTRSPKELAERARRAAEREAHGTPRKSTKRGTRHVA